MSNECSITRNGNVIITRNENTLWNLIIDDYVYED